MMGKKEKIEICKAGFFLVCLVIAFCFAEFFVFI